MKIKQTISAGELLSLYKYWRYSSWGYGAAAGALVADAAYGFEASLFEFFTIALGVYFFYTAMQCVRRAAELEKLLPVSKK